MYRRQFVQLPAVAAGAQARPREAEAQWVATAESLKPRLHDAVVEPVSIVRAVGDSSRFLRWRMERAGPATGLRQTLWKRDTSFILDFGRHLAGYVTFALAGEGEAVDSPVRLRLTFGEVPADVAQPLDPGTLSRAWMPDEVINVDFLPRNVTMPRRQAFRYVKVDVIDTSPNFSVRFDSFQARAVTSAGTAPPPPSGLPADLLRLDEVSLATLRDCMQTVFEDGPRRDRRLWVGDLRLQALTNCATYRNNALVKRCLYLLAGLPREDGLVAACVYDEPRPLSGRQYIMDYAVLFISTLHDYVRATGDHATARDLWPVVGRQLELVGRFVNGDGLFVDPGGWWIFIDWRDGLEKTAAMHAILLFAYREAVALAKLAGREAECGPWAARINAMTQAARATFWDARRGLFVSGKERQASWASQAWMVHAGVATGPAGAAALRAVTNDSSAVRPGTPYLYHYVVDAMLACGMRTEALALLRAYWGSMVDNGADTFWEVYDPSNPLLSPYKSVQTNSYCHAWSCTPSYFIRSRSIGRT